MTTKKWKFKLNVEEGVSVNKLNINEIFKDGGLFSKVNSSYKERPSQKEGANKLYESLKNNHHIICQGPTGYGKSYTYISATVLNMIENNLEGKVMFVTSNISLQDQLYKKDVPFVINALTDECRLVNEIKVAELKGINNFICKSKWKDSSRNLIDSENDIVDQIDDLIKNDSEGDLSRASFTSKKIIYSYNGFNLQRKAM